MPPLIYLAGPDVFLPDPLAHAATLKRICTACGLRGVSPLDPLPDEPASWVALAEPHRIARRNEAHIRRCEAILANISPFRGPSADAGTVYEIGFGRALGLPIFAYTNSATDYAARVRNGQCADGLAIEDFGLCDNLMIACAIAESGGFVEQAGLERAIPELTTFERCADRAAAVLLARR